MNNDIKQIIHKLRSSIQSCVGFVKFTKDWLEKRDESKLDHLVDYCDVASDSAKKTLELIDDLENAVNKPKSLEEI